MYSEPTIKVLFISCNYKGNVGPYIKEQADSLKREGVQVDHYLTKHGPIGYLQNIRPLLRQIKKGNYDLVHAHFGLSGILACLQRKVPVVVTFHGSDINRKHYRIVSQFPILFSKAQIFVTEQLFIKSNLPKNGFVIPCGIDVETFKPFPLEKARVKLNFEKKKKYVLFAGAFSKKVKNYPLAKSVCDQLGDDVELLELDGYNREEVCLLLNVCDVLLMTSLSEGSPQIIKEALACNRPIVSVDVGNVKELINNVENCFITERSEEAISAALKKCLLGNLNTNGREKIFYKGLDLATIAKSIKKVYLHSINKQPLNLTNEM